MRTKRTVSIFLAAALLTAGGFFAVTNTAHALMYGNNSNPIKQWLVGTGLDILQAFATGISYILNFLGGLAFAFGNMLTQTMLALNYQVLDSSNTIVTVGWGITRDVANLGFVLLIILVALATIVRYPSEYQAQKLLPRLIAAALLVNFSIAIVTPLIDFSDTLTQSFASRIGGDDLPGIPGSGFVGRISNAFGPHRLLIPPAGGLPEPVGFNTFSKAFLTTVGGLFFSFIFTWLAALVMLAIAFMLFLRYVHLTFLLAIAPIVWLFWVFPGLEKHWSTWWSDFLKWVFFAPAVMFFIYLAVTAMDAMGSMPVEGLTGSDFFETFILSIISQGTQMAVLGAFLVGSLIVGQKFGIAGAGAALNIAKAAKTQGLKLAGQRVKLAGRAAAGKASTVLKGGLEEKGLMKYPKKGLNLMGRGTSFVLGGGKKLDEALKVKDTDSGFKKLGKRFAGGVLGVTGGRALLKGAGGLEKTLTTASGRDVKVDSVGGAMFKTVKGEFLKEMGFEQEKPEKTTDDHVKDLKDVVKQKKALKDKGALTPESEKEWDKKIERAKGMVRNSLERPGTPEGLDRQIEQLKSKQAEFYDPKNGLDGSVFDDLIKERVIERDRIIEREGRKSDATREVEAKIGELNGGRIAALKAGDPEVTVKTKQTQPDGTEVEVERQQKLSSLFDEQIVAAEKIRTALFDVDERLRKNEPWKDQQLQMGLEKLRDNITGLNKGITGLSRVVDNTKNAALVKPGLIQWEPFKQTEEKASGGANKKGDGGTVDTDTS
ncbi:MAG: hypothetical protein Q7S84_04230 [bacterium]|nr:hypothetical protein [bacterium]